MILALKQLFELILALIVLLDQAFLTLHLFLSLVLFQYGEIKIEKKIDDGGQLLAKFYAVLTVFAIYSERQRSVLVWFV